MVDFFCFGFFGDEGVVELCVVEVVGEFVFVGECVNCVEFFEW